MTYHEQVATKMADSISVGSVYSYDQILAVLKERFPNEAELRELIKMADKFGQVLVPGFRYLDEGVETQERG